MLQTFTYYTLTTLLTNPKECKFLFEGVSYSTYYARDRKTLLINSFKTDKKAMKLSSFMYGLNKKLGIPNEKIEAVEAPKVQEQYIDPNPTLNRLSSPITLSDEFLETMQLSKLFKDDYLTHPNIKTYDNIDGTVIHEVLYCTNKKQHNIRFKWNGEKKLKGWHTLNKESGFKSIGGYIRGSKSKGTTLIMCEGLKDAINANIALPQCDVLLTDGKNQPFNFDLLEGEKYKTYICMQDKDVTAKELANLFKKVPFEDKDILRKMFYIDIAKLPKEAKDLTDLISSFGFSRAKLLRSGLAELKKVLHKDKKVIDVINAIEIENKIQPQIERAKDYKNEARLMELIEEKIKLGGNVSKEVEHVIKKRVTPPAGATTINLKTSKYLSDVTKKITEIFNRHSKMLLGSPTGTGKSTFTKGNLPKLYKNIIVITPLKKVSGDFSDDSNFTFVAREANWEADFNAPYISMTTDLFHWLMINHRDTLEQRLKVCELIAFDEQHLIEQSENFRGTVVAVGAYLEHDYNGKVIFMSGTPNYGSMPNIHPVSCNLDSKFMSTIKYYTDPFKDESELLNHILRSVKKGNVLIYSKSKKQAEFIQEYLIDNGITTLKVTSDGNNINGKNIKCEDKKGNSVNDEDINSIKENIAIVSTTRATTGVNFKNLSTIYQFGTAYDSDTLIQLMARLRSNGDYYYIKVKNEKAQDANALNGAIKIMNLAIRLKTNKLSDLMEHKSVINKEVELPYGNEDIKTFRGVYKDALALLASSSYGYQKQGESDFNFNILKNGNPIQIDEVKAVLSGSDENGYKKYFNRVAIDWVQKNKKIEMLNTPYNLSFTIEDQNKGIDYKKINGKVLETDERKKIKETEKEEKKNKENEFEELVKNKLSWLLTDKVKKAFDKNFTDGEKATLLRDKRLDDPKHQEEILKGRVTEDKLIRLKCYIIKASVLAEKVVFNIKEKGHITINELSTILEQEVRTTMKSAKNPYSKFIKDVLSDKSILPKDIVFSPRKRVNGIRERDVITLSKEGAINAKELANDRYKTQKLFNELKNKLGDKIEIHVEGKKGETLSKYPEHKEQKKEQIIKQEILKIEPKTEPKTEPKPTFIFNKNATLQENINAFSQSKELEF